MFFFLFPLSHSPFFQPSPPPRSFFSYFSLPLLPSLLHFPIPLPTSSPPLPSNRFLQGTKLRDAMENAIERHRVFLNDSEFDHYINTAVEFIQGQVRTE